MQLTIYTDYALRVLIYLGVHQGKSQISQIAESYDISFNHLTKAVHHLVKLGYVRSYQGRGGGIELARRPGEINLRAILEACEPHLAVVECMGQNNRCSITPACQLKSMMAKAKEAFLKEIGKYTLEDVLSSKQTQLRDILTSGLK